MKTPHSLRIKLTSLICVGWMAALSTGCAARSDYGTDSGAASQEIVYAENWEEVVYFSYGAKITLDHTGHFVINRNACYFKIATGALNPDDWNRVAVAVNAVANSPRVPSEECADFQFATNGRFKPHAEVELKQNGKHGEILNFHSYGKLCRKVQDETAAANLALELHRLAPQIQSRGCERPQTE